MQISHSGTSLDYADSSNVHTRESNKFAKQTALSSDTINRKSLSIAENSLSLVRENTDNQERFAKIETRAYINASGMKDYKIKVGEPIVYNMLFVNTGKTPAYNVRAVSTWKTGTGIYPHEVESVDSTLSQEAEDLIGGGQTQQITFGNGEIPKTFRDLDSISVYSKKYSLFIYGKIIYKDIFGGEHFTRFAFQYDVINHVFWGWKHYNEGN